jgi:hypothetical protein
MSLQCARFLIKSVAALRTHQTQPKGSVLYLLEPPLAALPFLEWAAASPEELVAMF